MRKSHLLLLRELAIAHSYVRQQSTGAKIRTWLNNFGQNRKTYNKETSPEKYNKNVYILILHKDYYYNLWDLTNLYIFFFFFYWHYNPLWVLAFSVILFHSALSSHRFLHHLIPIICMSSSLSIIHLFLGLPLILVPVGFHSNTLLGILLPSIRVTWPSQAILLLFIILTMCAFSLSLFSS